MALFTSTNDVKGLLPGEYGDLIVQPLEQESRAILASTSVLTGSHDYHIPVLNEDATAGWYSEGDDMSWVDPKFEELIVTPAKIGRVTLISHELATDSTPEAQTVVGESIARAIAAGVDEAFFGALAKPAASGLEALTGVSTVNAGTEWSTLDPFAEAIAASENVGGTLRTFVANPADALALAKVKKEDGSNEPLLGIDATEPGARRIMGVNVLVSPKVKAGTIWGIDPAFSQVVIRDDVSISVSEDVAFNTDQVAVKARMRVGFGFPHPASLVKINLTKATS